MFITWSLISIALSLVYFGLIYYYLKGWLKTPNHNTKTNKLVSHKATILLPIRNEEDRLQKCIDSILAQKNVLDQFELIIINDFSTDTTEDILNKIESPFVTVLHLRDFLQEEFANTPNKKRAITLGVEHAKHELICTIDGDCFYPEYWLLSMLQYYERTKRKLITGPVKFETDGSFWENFLQMDLGSLIGVTAGSVKQHKPVMANGANLLFEKQAFTEVNGFQGNDHIASGDDVYLMQKINKVFPKRIGFIKNRKAIATTMPTKTFKQFLNQRIRWTSKSAKMVDKKITVVLILNYLFYVSLFLNLFILPFFNWYFLIIGAILLGVKMIVDSIFFGNILTFFEERKLLKLLLPMELTHIIYVSTLGVLAAVGSYSWKGRSV